MRTAVLAIALACAFGRNITVDDTDPQWSYTPKQDVWGPHSKAAPCVGCQSQPDVGRVLGGTWHDATSEGSAVLSFTGVGATVYVICPGPHHGGQYSLSLSFTLDGVADGKFVDTPCPVYTYNYQVYHVTGLSRAAHTVEIVNHFHDTPLNTSNILLDYAVVDDGEEIGAGEGGTATGSTTTGGAASAGASTGSTATGGASTGSAASADTTNADATSGTDGGSSVNAAAVVVPILFVVGFAVFGLWFYRRKRLAKLRAATEPDGFEAKLYPASSVSPYTVSEFNPSTVEALPPTPSHVSPEAADPPHYDTDLEAAFSVILRRTRAQPTVSPPPPASYGGKRRATPPTSSTIPEPSAPPSYTDTLTR